MSREPHGAGGADPSGPPAAPRRAVWVRRLWDRARRPHRAHRIRWTIYTLVVAVACLAWAVGSATTRYSFGPHLADYGVTFDSNVTVDMGPLGSVVVPDVTPAPLGVEVVVHEIPAALGAVGLGGAVTDLSGDLQAYLSFFSAPQTGVTQVIKGLVANAALRFALAFAASWLVSYGIYRLIGAARRRELGVWTRANRAVPALGCCAVLTLAFLGADAAVQPAQGPEGLQVLSLTPLANTPFAKAYVTGRLGSLLNQAGTTIIDTYNEDQNFYQMVARRATAQLSADPMTHSPSMEHLTVAVFVTDLHCNVGMAPVIAAVAQGARAGVVLDGGDTTISGTTVERYCVDTFVDALPSGVTWVVSPGNHDSNETAGQERSAGMTVLDGHVVDVDGLSIVGDDDPRLTALGAGTTFKSEQTIADMASGVVDAACAQDEPVDVVLIHDGREVTSALRHGCAKLMLSGHMHKQAGPLQIGQGQWYQGSSTGRDVNETTQLTPLGSNAEMTLWYFDKDSGDPVYYRTVTMHPNGTVSLAAPQTLS